VVPFLLSKRLDSNQGVLFGYFFFNGFFSLSVGAGGSPFDVNQSSRKTGYTFWNRP
jgi:hypothetical protein